MASGSEDAWAVIIGGSLCRVNGDGYPTRISLPCGAWGPPGDDRLGFSSKTLASAGALFATLRHFGLLS